MMIIIMLCIAQKICYSIILQNQFQMNIRNFSIGFILLFHKGYATSVGGLAWTATIVSETDFFLYIL